MAGEEDNSAVAAEVRRWLGRLEGWDPRSPPLTRLASHLPLSPTAPTLDPQRLAAGGWTQRGERLEWSNGVWWTGGLLEGGARQQEGVLVGRLGECGCGNGGGVVKLEGSWTEDLLEGPGRLQLESGAVLHCVFRHGILHGFTRLLDREGKLLRLVTIIVHTAVEISLQVWYRDGRPAGLCWQFLQGGGFLVGELDTAGEFSDPHTAFLYPNLVTGLLGLWRAGEMVAASPCSVASATRQHNLYRLQCRVRPGVTAEYRLERATRTRLTSAPLLPDPYEVEMVVARVCRQPQRGDGLFLLRSVPPATVLAFYNGLRLSAAECAEPSADWREDAYKLADLGDSETVLDIPGPARSTINYCASLAHKTNHSFLPNTEFIEFCHPRWGRVPALRSTKHIQVLQFCKTATDQQSFCSGRD